MANPVPRVALVCSLEHLTDGELLAGTRRLVGRSNQLLAELLAHLGEVEARGIHRTRACSSLYTYCIYELRFSEDEAFRRVAAARLVRRFPALLDALAAGELHLTGLLLLGPHLTPNNLVAVLTRAKHRSKREIARLVRVLDPLPAVPARIEPLGPAPARLIPAEPTWEEFVRAACPVRELAPGERPRDWVGEELDAAHLVEGETDRTLGSPAPAPASPARVDSTASVRSSGSAAAPARVDSTASVRSSGSAAALPRVEDDGARFAVSDDVGARFARSDDAGVRSVRPRELGAIGAEGLGPERYKVQFTASEEYVRLVEQAKALLSNGNARLSFEELQVRAMRALVAHLSKKKFATLDDSGTGARRAKGGVRAAPEGGSGSLSAEPEKARPEAREMEARAMSPADPEKARGPEPHEVSPRERSSTRSAETKEHQRDEAMNAPHPRRRGRHIPAGVRRAVFERDGRRCSYVASTGQRCHETHCLEFHHLEPFAGGGGHSVANLALRCAAHNALAAEEDFGREFMESKKGRWESAESASAENIQESGRWLTG